MKYHNYVRKS